MIGKQETHTLSSSLDSQAKPSATQSVYDVLKQEIMWGEVEPGALLSELELAKRFGVSRTPVREALTMLSSDGLITTIPRRGHLVRTVSLSEILDAFRVRELLEVEAALQSTRRISDEEITRLRELAESEDDSNLPEHNREFHLTIARASGNRILADFIERLLILMQSVLIMDPHLAAWTEEGMREELDIIDALAARDEEAAGEAMRRHIRNTLSAILAET